MKIIWLPSWYPSGIDAFNGDFIQRHAEAVSLYQDIHVIYVVRDKHGKLTKDVLINESVTGRLAETIIYYYVPGNPFQLLEKFFSERKYRKIYKEAIQKYINENGRPSLVHVHVGMKAGIIALWLKEKYSIPYLVTEHWTGFLEEAKPNFKNLPAHTRIGWNKVLKHSTGVSAVSDYLHNALKKLFVAINGRVIPNVVNTKTFYQKGDKVQGSPCFVHISSLEPYKDPILILQAFKIVVENYPQARLEIFGAKDGKIHEAINELRLNNNVSAFNEVPHTVLAEHIRNASALILYSKYETFGCVIIEANACGVPVVVSDLPVFHETVREGLNGIFASPGDPGKLAARILDIIENRVAFDAKAIASLTTSKYSYPVVGKQFSDWYEEIARQ